MIEIGEDGRGWSGKKAGRASASIRGHVMGSVRGVESGLSIVTLGFKGLGQLATAPGCRQDYSRWGGRWRARTKQRAQIRLRLTIVGLLEWRKVIYIVCYMIHVSGRRGRWQKKTSVIRPTWGNRKVERNTRSDADGHR